MLQPKDTDWLNGYKNNTLYTRDPLQIQGHTQTESEEIGKCILRKWKPKENWSSNIHIRQKETLK